MRKLSQIQREEGCGLKEAVNIQNAERFSDSGQAAGSVFEYVDITTPGCDGWLNLFFGEYPIALINDAVIANEIRKVATRKQNDSHHPERG